MPFSKPWRKFEPGDLVYGINEDSGRKWYIQYGPFKSSPGENSPMRTIDEHAVLGPEFNKAAAKGRKLTEQENAFNSALIEHPKYNDAVGAKETNQTVRHKTKGGLYWATMVCGKHVHFVLDGIDIASVVGKSFKGKNSDRPATETAEKNRSITGSELRWIYRFRAHPDVQRYIQFWIGSQQVGPPWLEYKAFDLQQQDYVSKPAEEVAALWATYKPKCEHIHSEKAD